MLLRRIRYMITGRIIRFIMVTIVFLVMLLIICLFAFGVFNQKDVISWSVNGTINMGEKVEEYINEGDTGSVVLTDEGIYVDGYQPEGSDKLTSGGIIDSFFDFIHDLNHKINDKPENSNDSKSSDEKSVNESDNVNKNIEENSESEE